MLGMLGQLRALAVKLLHCFCAPTVKSSGYPKELQVTVMLTGESAGSKGGPCASWRLNSTTALEPPFSGAAHTCRNKRPQACMDAGAKGHGMAVECCLCPPVGVP